MRFLTKMRVRPGGVNYRTREGFKLSPILNRGPGRTGKGPSEQ